MRAPSLQVDVLRQDFRCVTMPCKALQSEFTTSRFILHPEISSREMPDSAQAAAATDAHRGLGICVHLQAPRQAEVFCNADEPREGGRAAANAAQFGLSRREIDRPLGRRPMLEEV